MGVIGAFVVPHPPAILNEVSHGREQEIQNTINGMELISYKIAELKPDTIVIVSPHSALYRDYFHISPGKKAIGNLLQFGVTSYSMEVEYDESFAEALSLIAKNNNVPAGTLGEQNPNLDHGTLVPLDFINKKYKNYKLVRIGPSGLSSLAHYNLGKAIVNASLMLNRKIVFIASGDLSHKLKVDGPYGFAKEGPEFDKEIVDTLKSGNFYNLLTFKDDFCQKAAECGLKSFQVMAGVLDGISVKPTLLSYEGPFGVGYGVVSYDILGSDNSRKFDIIYKKNLLKEELDTNNNMDPHVRLAKASLECYIKTGTVLELPNNLPKEITNVKAGTFVSLKKDGVLRGCIGTILPTESSIGKEIIRNAILAGCRDQRFSPVLESELKDLEYSVDVLGFPENIHDKNQLDVKKYGVIITSGEKRGLLLPNLDGIDNIDTQISIAKEKAGIGKEEPFTMERFQVVRYL
ncbi:AmmeMemoRadiSam system protein A [Fusobacterium sp. PH5-44]|uniref:AmmeMemoRadiSam system protein A n=1 Tax=unclassified Fusobacterium TaxID=2648384 RepID=UPI003D1E6326